MPDVDIFLVDWAEAKARHEKGVLREALSDEIKPEDKWIRDLRWFEKAPADYFDVAEAWERMKDELEDVPHNMNEAARAMMDVLITYQDYHNELDPRGENFLLTISPESAARFSSLGREVDFSLYKKAFDENCEDIQEELGRYLKGSKQKNPFENGFLAFVKTWIQMLEDAAKQKKGLLVVVQ